jgi:hypothetical protein
MLDACSSCKRERPDTPVGLCLLLANNEAICVDEGELYALKSLGK